MSLSFIVMLFVAMPCSAAYERAVSELYSDAILLLCHALLLMKELSLSFIVMLFVAMPCSAAYERAVSELYSDAICCYAMLCCL